LGFAVSGQAILDIISERVLWVVIVIFNGLGEDWGGDLGDDLWLLVVGNDLGLGLFHNNLGLLMVSNDLGLDLLDDGLLLVGCSGQRIRLANWQMKCAMNHFFFVSNMFLI